MLGIPTLTHLAHFVRIVFAPRTLRSTKFARMLSAPFFNQFAMMLTLCGMGSEPFLLIIALICAIASDPFRVGQPPLPVSAPAIGEIFVRHTASILSQIVYKGAQKQGGMKRVFIGGILLLMAATITARSKSHPLVFVFLRVDRERDVAILRPMIAPDIGVQLDSGPRELKRGTVLHCTTSTRERPAIVEGQTAQVSELVLDCLPAGKAGGDHKFVVKGLDFSARR